MRENARERERETSENENEWGRKNDCFRETNE